MKYITTCCLLLFTSLNVSAQKWVARDVSLQLGGHIDNYQSIDLAYMRSHAKSTDLTEIDLSNFREEVYQSVSGPRLNLNLTFSSASNITRELRIGLTAYFDRESMVTYLEGDSWNSLTYCVIQSEIGLSGAYLFRLEGKSAFTPYGGFGGSLGKTFGNKFLFLNATDYTFEGENDLYFGDTELAARSSHYMRTFVPFGLDFRLSRHSLIMLEGQLGLGLEQVKGANPYFIKSSFGAFLGYKYRF